MKKLVTVAIAFIMAFGTMLIPTEYASAQEEYAWVLVDTYKYPLPTLKPTGSWSYYTRFDGDIAELNTSIPYDIGLYGSRDYSNPVTLHAKYRWSASPSIIQPNEIITMQLEQEVIVNNIGKYSLSYSPLFKLDAADLGIGSGTASSVYFKGTYADGTEAVNMGIGSNKDAQSQVSYTADMTVKFRDAGTIGRQVAIYAIIRGGGLGSVGIRYTYEWKAVTPIVEPERPVLFTWQGQWETDWGDLNLTQNGSTVTGTYTHDSGKLSGTVSGNKLIGTWSEAPTYAAPSDAGDFEWTMSEDGKRFTGNWRYGSTGSWSSWGEGIRVSEMTPQPTDDWKLFDEKFNVPIDYEWTVRFSDIATRDKISAIFIEKDGVTLPIDVYYLDTNEIKVNAINGYDYDTRYVIKILLKNAKNSYMYFNTVAQPLVAETIWNNGNIYAVQNNPINPTYITLTEDRFITTISNYHYFNNGTLPGTISLVGEDGVTYGPWQATGRVGQGDVANAYWDVTVNSTLKAGVYRVIDSDPNTWSYNAQSDYTGFTEVKGHVLPQ